MKNEVEKLLKKKKEFKQKEKKLMEIHIQFVTSVDYLVGKRVKHLTSSKTSYGGKGKWFRDVARCQKTDPDATFVIRYDCEDKLYSFKFSDFENSVVKLTYITATDILVRQAKERFSLTGFQFSNLP